MIVGKGDIAQVLAQIDRPNLLFFASGVSNSQETDPTEYMREREMLMSMNRRAHLVYFSTLSVYYSNSQYAIHKRLMENLVKNNWKHYTIVRIGNITWGINPNTIINSIRNKIKLGIPYQVKAEYRYIVDKEEFLHWVNRIPEWSCEMNIPGKMMTVQQVIDAYCK